MCHKSLIVFGASTLRMDEVKGRRVIEVGSRNVNGSLRPIIESWEPSEYIGVDIDKGPGVDLICDAKAMVEKFGEESFDVVITTELLEHVRDWRNAISNIKRVCKTNGIVLLTTRSCGYGYHGYPYDFWRYEVNDMKEIFSDSEIVVLESDPQAPGVLVKVRKPSSFVERDLSAYLLYSIVLNKRVTEMTDRDFESLTFLVLTFKETVKRVIFRVANLMLQKVYPDQYYK